MRKTLKCEKHPCKYCNQKLSLSLPMPIKILASNVIQKYPDHLLKNSGLQVTFIVWQWNMKNTLISEESFHYSNQVREESLQFKVNCLDFIIQCISRYCMASLYIILRPMTIYFKINLIRPDRVTLVVLQWNIRNPWKKWSILKYWHYKEIPWPFISKCGSRGNLYLIVVLRWYIF